MLFFINSIYCPINGIDKVILGRIKFKKPPLPETGSQFSFTENNNINEKPNQKTGIETNIVVMAIIILSIQVPVFTADKIPIGKEINIIRNVENIVNWKVAYNDLKVK